MDPVESIKRGKEEDYEEAETELPKEPELTQTDHINKAMLSSFKAMLDKNQFQFPTSAQPREGEDADDDGFIDDGKYDESLYDVDPEKAEEERKKVAAFLRNLLRPAAEGEEQDDQQPSENIVPPPSTTTTTTTITTNP